jgi:hypothetical protein
MFHAYRRSGREGSRQRAINFDSEVVDRVFPAAADTDRIPLSLRYDTDSTTRELPHSLKRQAKNWRFEGNCPVDELYAFVEPGCLFALQVEAGAVPATGSWVVFPKDDQVTDAVLSDGATAGLAGTGMIALELDEAPRVLRLLSAARPDMFTSTLLEAVPPMSDNSTLADTAGDSAPAARSLPPGPERLAAILGDAGHSFVSAVADIIDNSISAGATLIDITFDPPNSGHGRWLAIRDNGCGMTRDQLMEAMRVGGEANYDQRSLGKYGYGLKGASWSQARAFTVVTRPKGGEQSHATWDRDNMAGWQVDQTPLQEWEAEAADPDEHGTVVLWKKMKAATVAPSIRGVPPHVAEIQELNRHLGTVFHRFLDGDAKGRPLITIRINHIPVESNGPVSHPLAQAYDVKTVKTSVDGGMSDVKVQPYLLPSEDELRTHHAADGSDAVQRATDRIGYWGRRNDTQGLFIYRNDRLIRWGGWHELWQTNDEKTKLARVLIDFDPALDEAFQINISKQTVRLPGSLQARIKPLADEVRKASQAKYRRPRLPASPPLVSPSGGPVTAPAVPRPQPPSPDVVMPQPAPPQQPVTPLTVRQVTAKKFAWKFATGLTGGRSLQVSEVSPALAILARAVESSPEAAEALATFLEELDRLGLQQALIDDAASE